MTIRSAQAIPVSLPFEMGGPKPLFAGIPRQMEMLLIRVETTDGLVGWGEAFGLAIWPATRAAFERLVAPLVTGRDETDIAGVHEALERPLHILGRGGPVMYAISGLDIALWDLAGKRAGQPLSNLLGTRRRERLAPYASLMRYGDPALVERNAAEAVRRGFGGVKLHEVRSDCVRAARRAIGPEAALMMDVNCPWTVDQSLAMCDEVRGDRLLWLEEPVWPPEDVAGLAQVRRQGGIAIAAGENVMSAEHLGQMLEAGAVDYLQPSVTKIGGVTGFMKAVAMARAHGVALAPHSPYFGPGLLATLHIAATLDEAPLIEYSYAELGASPLGEAIVPHGGWLRVPDGPGLGCDPDPAVIDRWRLP